MDKLLKFNNKLIKKGSWVVGQFCPYEWDVWDRTTYNDTSWQETLTKDGTVGTVTISSASQFINFGSTVDSFYTSNSLSRLDVNLSKHLRFNDSSNLTTATEVYDTLTSSGVKAQTSTNGFLVTNGARNININGNGHVIQGLYCYTTNNHNGGSFCRFGDGGSFSLNNLTFDRCCFRSNSQASAGFSMINSGTTFTTNLLNFNKCAISSESTANYQTIMFGGLNTNATYVHINTSLYGCGFRGALSWSNYSCGDGSISGWYASVTFYSNWTNCTYINPYKLGGNGTMKLYAGEHTSLTLNGTNTYYNIGTGITAQGTAASSEQDAIDTFNNTVEDANFILALDKNGNLFHKIEI